MTSTKINCWCKTRKALIEKFISAASQYGLQSKEALKAMYKMNAHKAKCSKCWDGDKFQMD